MKVRHFYRNGKTLCGNKGDAEGATKYCLDCLEELRYMFIIHNLACCIKFIAAVRNPAAEDLLD